MLAYKYRDGNTKKEEGKEMSTFERDINSLQRNYFFAPTFDNLNDPCETRTVNETINYQIELLSKIIDPKVETPLLKMKDIIKEYHTKAKGFAGIYALSKTYLDEILWAHYGNSHYGFCIEFDLDLIENNYQNYKLNKIDVKYKENPPQIDVKDLYTDLQKQVEKLAGYKAKKWEYEEEIRLVTNLSGIYPYPPNCVKAIYFGLRMEKKEREIIINKLKGRGIKYYEIIKLLYIFESPFPEVNFP